MYMEVILLLNSYEKDSSEAQFKTGQIAKMTGVTVRTLRYYDSIGILKPTTKTEEGNRLYCREDIGKLQKITTLKFIGLSLKDIHKTLRNDIHDRSFISSLYTQKEIITEKINHMIYVSKAIEKATDKLQTSNEFDWEGFTNIIKAINMEKDWFTQYQNATKLIARIHLHDLYSTNKTGWHRWVFSNMKIPKEARILEIGCGDGSLWSRNIECISNSWDIVLSDQSEGMIEDVKRNFEAIDKLVTEDLTRNEKKSNCRFKFDIEDAMALSYKDSSFDVVIANNMLFHVSDRQKAISEISRVLKPTGIFYASTISSKHLKEIDLLVNEFTSEIGEIGGILYEDDVPGRFGLENGEKQLKARFSRISLIRYEDSLKVTEALPLVDYILTIPRLAHEIVSGDRLKRFIKFVESKIKTSGYIQVTKDTGLFKAMK